jgi:hypothetical protein
MATSWVTRASGNIVNPTQGVLVEPDSSDNYLGTRVCLQANSGLFLKLDCMHGDVLLQAIEAMRCPQQYQSHLSLE